MANDEHKTLATVVSEAKEAIAAAVSSMRVSASRALEPIDKVLTACDQLSLRAATAAVLFSGQPPQATEAKAVVQSLLQLVIALADSIAFRLVGATGVLTHTLKMNFRRVGESVIGLMDGLAAVVVREVHPRRLAVLAEQVRQRAAALKASPLDNNSALCNVVAAAGISVRDVQREMLEMAEEHQAHVDAAHADAAHGGAGGSPVTASINDATRTSKGAGSGLGGAEVSSEAGAASLSRPGRNNAHGEIAVAEDEDVKDDENENDDDAMLDFGGEELASEEAARLQEGLAALDRALHAVQEVEPLAQRASLYHADSIAAWDVVAKHVSGMQVAADELGAALYPPQVEAQVKRATDKLLKAADDIHQHAQAVQDDYRAL